MSITNSGDTFDTEDFGQAIALSCRQYQLTELQRDTTTGRVTFCFKRADGIDQDALDYWSGKFQVDAKLFWNESRNLKTRLYGSR